ncbi:hypothetical protein KR222_000855, partial [Zaprionus bogoriensis]
EIYKCINILPTGAGNKKLKFSGSCSLTDSELSTLYNLDALTEDELASVGIERSSLIDDYRHLHEQALLHDAMKRQPMPSQRFISKLQRPKFKSPRKPTKPFSYDLLNRFFRCMQSEAVAFCRFMEVDLKILTDIQRDTKILLMSPKEREVACYESYFNYLDRLYQAGEQDRVISIVAKVMINFQRNPKPVKLL